MDPEWCDHGFPEERESGGRVILGPCLSCGMSALEAMAALKAERDAAQSDLERLELELSNIRQGCVALASALRYLGECKLRIA